MEAASLVREGGAVRSRALVAKPGRGTARPQGAPFPDCHCYRFAGRCVDLTQCPDKVGQMVHAGR
jgi:hypothetical protein